jgi:hypothetical protein
MELSENHWKSVHYLQGDSYGTVRKPVEECPLSVRRLVWSSLRTGGRVHYLQGDSYGAENQWTWHRVYDTDTDESSVRSTSAPFRLRLVDRAKFCAIGPQHGSCFCRSLKLLKNRQWKRRLHPSEMSGSMQIMQRYHAWLQIQRFRIRFTELPDFLRSSWPGAGSAQPHEDRWGATWTIK